MKLKDLWVSAKKMEPGLKKIVGGLLFISGFLAAWGLILTKDWGSFWVNISTEILGIIITVLFIDYFYQQRDEAALKSELENIFIFGKNKASVLEAFEKLKANYWTRFETVLFSDKDFTEANLQNIEFFNCHFVEVNFSHANLSGAKFHNCYFQSVNFLKSDLTSVDLSDSKFSQRNGGEEFFFRNASSMFLSTMPNGNRYDGRFRLTFDIVLAREMGFHTDDANHMANFYNVPVNEYVAGQKWADEHPQFSGGITLG